MAMKDFYKKKKQDAVGKMEILRGVPHIENTWEAMHAAATYIHKHRTSDDIVSADMVLAMWVHFHCEEMTEEEKTE